MKNPNTINSRKPLRIYRDAVLILFIVSALGMVYLLIFGENGYIELRKKEWDVKQVELQRNTQLEFNKKLEEEISLLKTNRDRIEREAREQFKLVREGDIILKTASEESDTSTSPASKQPLPSPH